MKFGVTIFLVIICSCVSQGYLSIDNSDTECKVGTATRVRYFKLVVENYSTMGPACKECPKNITSCNLKECVTADGYQRTIITVNREMPGTPIHVCKGDTVVVDVVNHLLGQDTSMHWHGILQRGTPYMDGASFITQCPITEGSTFRYKFKAEEIGTYFYHSHHGMQKMDGMVGLFVVRSPEDPSASFYDTDHHVLFLQDWTHELTGSKVPGPIALKRRGQQANNLLINGKGSYMKKNGQSSSTPLAEIKVQKNIRHRVRIVNGGCFECPLQLFIQEHEMSVIAVDGFPIQPVTVDSVIVLPGERVDVVVHATKNKAAYWIIVRALADCADSAIYQRGILIYDGASNSTPETPDPGYNAYKTNTVLNPMEAKCGPGEDGICAYQLTAMQTTPATEYNNSETLEVPFNFYSYHHDEIFGQTDIMHKVFYIPGDGEDENDYELQCGQMNNISMIMPRSPPLSQPHGLSVMQEQHSCNTSKKHEHQNCFHFHQVPMNSKLEIVFIHDSTDEQGEAHPMHLHGYRFYVMYQGYNINDCRKQASNTQPVLKDTVNVPGSGCARILLYADNPGFWLLHCHIIHHQLSGMSLLLQVGDYSDMPQVPLGFPSCGDFLPALPN